MGVSKMTMTNKLPNKVVEAAIRGETQGDHAGKISQLEAEKAKIKAELDKELSFEERMAHLQGAYGKLVAAFRHDLTPEERKECEGKYFVIEGGMVQMLRLLPKSK